MRVKNKKIQISKIMYCLLITETEKSMKQNNTYVFLVNPNSGSQPYLSEHPPLRRLNAVDRPPLPPLTKCIFKELQCLAYS